MADPVRVQRERRDLGDVTETVGHVHPDDLARAVLSLLATDAGQAAVRAVVRTELRAFAFHVAKLDGSQWGEITPAAIIEWLATPHEPTQDGGSAAWRAARIGHADDCPAAREPAQDEPAAGVTPEPPQHAEAMADLLRELEGWKDGPNSSDDTRRKHWLMRRAAATIRALAAQRDDLEAERNDLIYTRQLAPPAASQPAQEPAAGARRETPHSGPEFGWVIERGDTPVFAPLYFAFHQHAGDDLNDDPPNGWLWDFDNLKAARFARREDAEKFWTCAIGRDRDEVRVAEHGWGTPPAAPDPLLPGLRAARQMLDLVDYSGMSRDDALATLRNNYTAAIARRGGA